MKIREIIVVEGKDDTVAIKRAVHADTIETNGSAINQETIEQIKLAAEKRGVIIFTDPDYPGEKIRKTISSQVPNCKHAFLNRQDAIAKTGKGLGVEHASVEAIRNALSAAYTMFEEPEEQISVEDLLENGLIGDKHAKIRREKLGVMLKIGYTNGKQLQKRLRMFQISREVFLQVAERILQEDPLNE
ncbi:ribonuclease M5 [Bacillus kwashiorkori]|uniref:ribonuclease M5 n=1 Tax=Bacillus kwashiorkori TaxID=1522318 RepID=UPI000B2D8D73|nr:ribonuclease M5 [Bacillus kwashiorkori]